MADDEKEKAEKVAAAKKRYEQLKKQKKKAAESKKKDDKGDEKGDDKGDDKVGEADGGDDPAQELDADAQDVPSSATGEAVADIYRKQAARIEALEAQVAAHKQSEADEAEIEELRAGQGEVKGLRARAEKADELQRENERLNNELSSVRRQLTSRGRRVSGLENQGPDDLQAKLAARQQAVEALELDVSNLRHDIYTRDEKITELESSLASAKAEADSSKTEAEEARREVEAAREAAAKESESTEEDPKEKAARLASALAAAEARTSQLERKAETLGQLHKAAETRWQAASQQKDAEIARLRTEIETKTRHRRSFAHGAGMPSTPGGPPRSPSTFDDIDLTPAESGWRRQNPGAGAYAALTGIIDTFSGRDAASNPEFTARQIDNIQESAKSQGFISPGFFDAARGWLDQQLQSNAAAGKLGSFGMPSFEPVHGGPGTADALGPSAGDAHAGGDDDDDFDEEKFAAAQQAAATARLERVKAIKRGLSDYKGFRLDLVSLRGGVGAEVFEV